VDSGEAVFWRLRLISMLSKAFWKVPNPRENRRRAMLLTTAPVMGVRDSRRIVGEFELGIDDFLARRQFPDQVAVYNRPTDVHPSDTSKKEYERFLKDFHGKDNLGRGNCVGSRDIEWLPSGDRRSQRSIRRLRQPLLLKLVVEAKTAEDLGSFDGGRRMDSVGQRPITDAFCGFGKCCRSHGRSVLSRKRCDQ